MRLPCVLIAFACAAALGGCGRGDGRGASPAPVVLWAVGDGGSGTEPAKQVARLIARDDPAHVIYLGDVYETGTAEEFTTNFGDVYGELVQRMWPTPGNHEWDNHATGYDPFWRQALGRRQPSFYGRQAGGWDVLSANSQTPEEPAQLDWLHDQVAGAGDCRLVFWHRPRFNAGEHREEELDVAPLWDAIEGHAAILLSGHDHNMQRFKPVDGTTQYVSGAGGKSHYPVEADDPRLAFSDSGADGALRIALTPGRAELRFVRADGAVLDRSSVTCQG